ncbi:MAG: glutamine synthetase family protein [Microthrixaceae bacterium]
MLTLDELTRLHELGEIDTVLVVFPDMQGRLMGKRVVSSFFLDQLPVNGGAIEACDYLLAVDLDMEVLAGFRFTNWETGYGDFVCRPDMSTLCRVPWLDRTALVIGDLVDHHDTPIPVSPREIAQRQIRAAAEIGFTVKVGTELEFFVFRESMDEAADKGFQGLTPGSNHIIDYHILATSSEEDLIRTIRNDMVAAGLPVEYSKGEAGRGQHELNLRYADALRMADNHTIYRNGAKEIAAAAGRALTFMAKYDMDEVGSSCHIHSSLWTGTPGESGDERSAMPAEDGSMSDTFRWWLGGLLDTAADFALCWAPFVNSYKRYQPGSWAPTAIGWGTDNRTLGFRVVGSGQGLRVESRIPGSDCNPYLAIAATIAGGLHGIANRIEPPDPFDGNGYTADLPRIPHTLIDAIGRFERSEVALAAFGEDVHFHLLHLARQEWDSFNRHVTDWELRRNFEQL